MLTKTIIDLTLKSSFSPLRSPVLHARPLPAPRRAPEVPASQVSPRPGLHHRGRGRLRRGVPPDKVRGAQRPRVAGRRTEDR